MSNRSQFFTRGLAALIVALVAAPAARATITPEAARVVERYVAAIGGRAAVDAERSVHSRSTLQAFGFTGSLEGWSQRPDRIASQTALGPFTLKDGYDGTTAWRIDQNGKLSLYKRTLPRCMGMTAHRNSIYVSSLFQLWRFENILGPGKPHDGYDRLYVPQVGYITGDVDIHDMAVDRHGLLVFVNTLFACLATVSETHSFQPLWKPPFISKLAAEDRCHLNGLAMRDGSPAFVTAGAGLFMTAFTSRLLFARAARRQA